MFKNTSLIFSITLLSISLIIPEAMAGGLGSLGGALDNAVNEGAGFIRTAVRVIFVPVFVGGVIWWWLSGWSKKVFMKVGGFLLFLILIGYVFEIAEWFASIVGF